MTTKTRPGECKFCTSRKCSTRIATPNMSFDEVACGRHIKDLYSLSDDMLGKNNGVMRTHISSTGSLKRGEPLP